MKKTYTGGKLHPGQLEIVKDIMQTKAMYYTVCCPRQFGKSYMALQLMLYYAINNPNSKIMFTSPTYSQCSKVYKELLNAVKGTDVIVAKNSAENSLTLISGSEIYFKSIQQPDNLRGYSIDYMFCDEAAMYKDEVFYSCLRPMLTVRGKKCFLLSTPKGKNFFFNLFQLGKDGIDPMFRSYIASSDGNPFANQLEIENARKSLPDAIFRQEYLAEFVDGGSVFPHLSEAATIKAWTMPVLSDRYSAGLDLALQGDFLVLTILNKAGRVVNSYRATKTPMSTMLSEVKKLLDKYNPKCTLVETNGIGNGIYETISKLHKSVRPFNTSNKSKQDIIENLIYDLNEGDITVPHKEFFPHYVDEMTNFGFEYSVKTRKVKYFGLGGAHDDCVMSLAIANEARRSGVNYGVYNLNFG